MIRRSFLIALLSAGLGLARPALAACTQCSCAAGSSTVAFGIYDPASGAATSSTGEVSVTCTLVGIVPVTASYEIRLSTGTGGSYSPRTLSFGASHINYNLYTTSGHSTVWGDGSGSTNVVGDSYTLGLVAQTRHYSVFGRIPGGQNIAAGSYTDVVIVTIVY